MEPLVSDEYIEEHENIMEIPGGFDYFKVVPAYMLWCLKYKDKQLVDMHTVNSLAEYGRAKDSKNEYLNFKWRCNEAQKAVITKFLKWCATEILTADTTQIERALKHW